jgi:hypothetical protein
MKRYYIGNLFLCVSFKKVYSVYNLISNIYGHIKYLIGSIGIGL